MNDAALPAIAGPESFAFIRAYSWLEEFLPPDFR